MKGSQADAFQAGPCRVHSAVGSTMLCAISWTIVGHLPTPRAGGPVHVSAIAAWQLESSMAADLNWQLLIWEPRLEHLPCLPGRYPQDWTLTYFRSVPHSLYWPMWAISILAAIIASQVRPGRQHDAATHNRARFACCSADSMPKVQADQAVACM